MLGTSHRRIAGALAFTLAFVLARAHAAPTSLEIPFELSGNHVVVPVRVHDRDLHFVLDTGAATSLIDTARARELGVPLGQPFAVRGAGPGTTAGRFMTTPEPIRIGSGNDAVTQPVMASIDFTSLSTHAGRDLDGILGGDFIRRFVLEIDYEHQTLRLHEPATFAYNGKGTTLPLTFTLGFPHVRGTLTISEQESFDADCVLDVGSSLQVAVTHPVAEAHGLAEKLKASAPVPVGRGAGGVSEGRLARLPAIQLGDITVKNTVASLAGPNAGVMSSSQAFEVNVGTGVMRHFTMYFDYGRSKVTFEPNGLTDEPFEHDMTGLVLTTEGRPYKRRIVEMAVPDLPAARAGIRDGDVLESIDDVGADTLSMDQLRKLFMQDGRTYRIVVQRDGKRLTLTMTTRRIV